MTIVCSQIGETPLHLACKKGDVDRVRIILASGGDVNAKDHNGWTPLHEACAFGSLSCVQALLDHSSATVDVLAAGGDNGLSPLHEAVDAGDMEVAKALLEFARLDRSGELSPK